MRIFFRVCADADVASIAAMNKETVGTRKINFID
jgi:hypothetical protein